MGKKQIKLTKIEKALIVLAKHADRCPYNQYRIEEEVLEELGYEKTND